MKKPKEPTVEGCEVKGTKNAKHVEFSILGKQFQGFVENLQTEQGVRMFLMTVSDELEIAGAQNPYPVVKEAFFALKTPFIPKEVLEAVRG